jgi:acyl dehydratase
MTVQVGDVMPSWSMDSVEPARMKTMAAILRDPYPVHWDPAANEALGLGGRVINQGPLNLSYIVNMLLEWAGPTSIRRLTVSFARPVLDGDRVVAGGRVIALDGQSGEQRATCEVWLERNGEHVVDGTAVVALTGNVGISSPGAHGAPVRPASGAELT